MSAPRAKHGIILRVLSDRKVASLEIVIAKKKS